MNVQQLRSCLAAAFGATLWLLALAQPLRAAELRPFEASYAWIWHGMTVAVSRLTLEQQDDTWVYRSASEPRGIGRLLAERPKTVSVLRATDAGVQPLSYEADDGTGSPKRTVKLRYDWQTGRVTGTYEQAHLDLPLGPEVQDDSSAQVAMMLELIRGRKPDHFALVDKSGVREYRYRREGEETLETALGRVATVVYASERANSPRVNRYWCAPEHGFVPMRVEQKRADEVQWTMEIQSLRRK